MPACLAPGHRHRVRGLAHARERLSGGLRLPGDETGDCHLFTRRLAQEAQRLGVEFRFNTQVHRLLTNGTAVTSVELAGSAGSPAQVTSADRVVLALGSYSRQLLQPLGLDLPVYPVKGYSLTIPLRDEALAPQSTVLDETYKIALTRLGNRIRVGGMAELGGIDLRLNPRRRATLEMVTQDLFPGGDLPRAEFWTGLRPMTPDSTPLIGATRWGNLYLNTGHGTLGWTMACGSARVVSDLVMGRSADIRTDDLGLHRYEAPGRRRLAMLPPLPTA
jgi:D-amino-acid dehydrogenase